MFQTFPPSDVQQSLSAVSRKLTEQSQLATKSGKGPLKQLLSFLFGLFRKRKFEIAIAGAAQVTSGQICDTSESLTYLYGPT